jgi:rhodanese-related sulfurtransferase
VSRSRSERIAGARTVIGATLLLGILAAFAGSPERSRNARIDVSTLASEVEHEADHVTALELAQWIRERRAGLRVIDIRSTSEFEAFHVPTAERIPLTDLTRTPFRSNETIVLYSEGGAHAAQGWVFLRALGYERVYFLRGGLYEWLDQVMNASIPEAASDSVRKEFARVADLSRYFGGSPRMGAPRSAESVIPIPVRDSASALRTKILTVRGRGC